MIIGVRGTCCRKSVQRQSAALSVSPCAGFKQTTCTTTLLNSPGTKCRFSSISNTQPPMITQYLKRPSPNKRSLENATPEKHPPSDEKREKPHHEINQKLKHQKNGHHTAEGNGLSDTATESAEIPPELKEVDKSWLEALEPELKKQYWKELQEFLAQERKKKTIFPPQPLVFSALRLTPLHTVKVVILGQDPYHGPNQAHGLAFSVPKNVKTPPSLVNILKEVAANCGTEKPSHGLLSKWAEEGVLLLNTVLTVEAHKANSHKNRGWEKFTDQIIRAVNQQAQPIVFMLWGKPAQQKESMLNKSRHLILKSPHPSPLSAHRGFLGCGHFEKANEFLKSNGRDPIDWSL